MIPIQQTLVLLVLLLFGCHQADTSHKGQKQVTAQQGNNQPGRAGYTAARLKAAATAKMPMSMVRSVRQASNGDILIASYLGVFRYNGTSFTNITSTIPSPSFWDVLEDRKGNLWFGSKDSGAYCYNGKVLQHFTTKDGLPNNRIVKMYEDKAGNMWFATGGGASRYDGKAFRNFTTKEGLSNNDLTNMLEDKTGKFWFGTRGDACYYDGKTFTVLRNKKGEAFYNVWGLAEDKKGNIWIGGSIIKEKKGSSLYLESGLWYYDGQTITKASDRAASAIIQDKKGNIWTVGELQQNLWALLRYDAKSLYNTTPAVKQIMTGKPFFSGLLEATDGSIWMGAFGPECWVYRYDGKTITDFRRK
jgi:ligand-binding sensor domain-containing protein